MKRFILWSVAVLLAFLPSGQAVAGPNANFPASVPITSEHAHYVLNHWIRERVMPYYFSRGFEHRLGPCHGSTYIKHCRAVFTGRDRFCSGTFTVWQDRRNWYTELHNYQCKERT